MADGIEVLVVGGGPTGLCAALGLARLGIRCRVVEKATEHFAGSRGKGVMPKSQEVFDDLGIIDVIAAHSEPNPPIKMFDKDKSTGVMYFQGGDGKGHLTSDPDIPYPVQVVLPQWQTEQILRDKLASLGVSVELGREFVALEQDDEGVVATIRHADSGALERVQAEYLIGADGGRSSVRSFLEITFEGTTSQEQTYLIGDLEIEGLDHGFRYAWFNSDTKGFAQACPMHDSPIWQFGGNVFPDADGNVPEPTLELFQKLLDDTTGTTKYRLHDAIWTSKFVYNCRMVDQFRVGRVFVAGDAAHVHSPVTGEGLNSGVQDAYNLSWKLAFALRGVDPSILDTYGEERLPVANALLSSSAAGHMTLFSSKPLTKFIRQGIVLPALRIPALNRKVMRRLSGLDIDYQKSSMSVDELGAKGKVRAGSRAPDGRVLDPCSGAPMRLFDVFRGPQFTLLTFGAVPDDLVERARAVLGAQLRVCRIVSKSEAGTADAKTGRFVDDTGKTTKTYGARQPTAYVIRPDNYVGYRGGVQSAPLLDYLERFRTLESIASA